MLLKMDIYFQDLSFDTQSQVIQNIVNSLIVEQGLSDEEAEEQADHYINTHNFSNKFVM